MSKSRDRTQGKCFSSIVSRFLCTRSLPTHPTPSPENDQITNKAKHQSFKDLTISSPIEDISLRPRNKQQDAAKETPTPGVVARLMGLETVPPKDGNLGSYLRSRSVNYVDYLYSCDDLITGEPQHRRVKTSLSFREVPATFEKGDALKKEKGDQTFKKTRVNNCRHVKQKVDKSKGDARDGGNFLLKKHGRISEKPSREIYTRSSLKIEASRKRANPERTNGGTRDVHLGLNNKLKNKKKKKRLTNRRNPDECYPDSTGSVSDSCPQDSALHLKVNKSGNQELTCTKKNLPKHNCFNGTFDKEDFCSVSRRDLKQTRRCMNMLGEVRKLAECEITRTSWTVMNFEDLEEICVYLGENILELLLNYLTGELLVEFSNRIRYDCNLDSRLV